MEPIYVPGTPKINAIIPEPIQEAKPLESIPEAPVLPPIELPELPMKVSVPEEINIEETKPLTFIPDAPTLPLFTLPEMPLKVYESAPIVEPCPPGAYLAESEKIPKMPEMPKFEEIKPLVPIPEAPVLGPFTLPELPLKVSIEESKPCDAEDSFIISPKEPEFIDEGKLTIPEAPKLPLFTLPEFPLKFETSPAWIPMPDAGYFIDPREEEAKLMAPIPEAPVLGPFTLPDLPLKVSAEESKRRDSDDTLVILPKEPEFIEENKLTIPEAPKLPPFTLPKVPLKVETAPTWIPMPHAGYFIERREEEVKPLALIPEAPVLGSFTLPDLPVKVSLEEPCDSEDSFIESPKISEVIETNKLIIHKAPELPPLVLPEIPTKVLYVPELPASIETNNIFESPKIEELAPIPAAPELPPIKFEAISEIHLMSEIPKNLELKPIPKAPELPPLAFDYNIPIISTPIETKVIEEPAKVFFVGSEDFKLTSPEFCAHTILKERVIPKFIGREMHYKIISFPVKSEQTTFKIQNPGFISYIPAGSYDLPVFSI